MKQTAVEQMYLEIFAIVIGDIYLNDRTMFKVQNLIEKYREMEKEQIIEAYCECWGNMGGNADKKKPEAEQYYNETYGKDEK